MVQEDKALQQKKRPSLPVVHKEEEIFDGDLIKLQLQYFGSTALPLTLILEIMGAQLGGIALAVGAGVGVAYFARDIHYGVEPVLKIGAKVLGLLGGSKGGRTANRLTNKDWWLGQEVASYAEDGEEGEEIDPEILEMLRSGGGLEGAVSLLERARLANIEEETGVPSFRKLLEDGTIQRLIPKGLLIIGYIDGKPRIGTWFDLYSCGVGGVSGSGKSTTVRFLLFQMILAGGHLIMIDPHIGDEEESLAAEFRSFVKSHLMPPCNDDEKAVLKRVRWLMTEFLYRKSKGIKGPPILFVLDEYNALVRRLSDLAMRELAELLLTLAQEGRKFGLFAMIIAQRWSENDLGGRNYGAAIRGSLSSRMGHRFADEDQAKRFMGSKYGPKLLEIAKGHHLFRDTEGAINETVTPNTIQSDGEIVRRLLGMPQQGVSFPTALSGREVDVEEEVDPLDEEEEEFHDEPEEVVVVAPIIPEKGPKAADIDINILCACWNGGANTVSKLEALFKMSHGEAYKAYKRIKAQKQEVIEEQE